MTSEFREIRPEQLKAELKAANRHGLALDIDEVLAYTNGHWVNQMLQRFGNPEGLTTAEFVAKYRYVEHVPYWSGEEVSGVIDEFRNSNDTQEQIPLIPDANHLANRLNAIVPVVAYITARPRTVFEGTARWLATHGFPPAPVVLKPTELSVFVKNHWKGMALAYLWPQVIGIVDDNPGLVEELPPDYAGTIYLYDHPEYKKDGLKIVACKDWPAVLEAVNLRQ